MPVFPKRWVVFVTCATTALFSILPFLLLHTTSHAAERTIGRLTISVPTQLSEEFQETFETTLAPSLIRNGFVQSNERPRATIDGVFSKLFEFRSLLDLRKKVEAIQKDSEWRKAVRDLGVTYGEQKMPGPIPYAWSIYLASGGQGKSVTAGPGTGHWRVFDVADGLGPGEVGAIVQDQDDRIWFATGGGVSLRISYASKSPF